MAQTVTVLSAASLAASGLLWSHGEERQGSEEKGQQGVEAFDLAINPASLSHLTLGSKACWGGLFQGKPEDSHRLWPPWPPLRVGETQSSSVKTMPPRGKAGAQGLPRAESHPELQP